MNLHSVQIHVHWNGTCNNCFDQPLLGLIHKVDLYVFRELSF